MYESIFTKQKQFYQTGKTKPLNFRIEALKQLKRAVRYYEKELMQAMKRDFNKQKEDAYLTEIGYVYNDINHTFGFYSVWI